MLKSYQLTLVAHTVDRSLARANVYTTVEGSLCNFKILLQLEMVKDTSRHSPKLRRSLGHMCRCSARVRLGKLLARAKSSFYHTTQGRLRLFEAIFHLRQQVR